MHEKIHRLNTYLAAMAFALAIPLVMLQLGGCTRKLDPTGPYKGDMFLYQSHQTILDSQAAMSNFVAWEAVYHNQLLKQPEITEAANYVRTNAHLWVFAAQSAVSVYEASPTTNNANAVTRTLSVLNAGVVIANRYVTAGQPPAPPLPLNTNLQAEAIKPK